LITLFINFVGLGLQKEVMFLKGLSTVYIFLGKFIPQKINGILKPENSYWQE